MKEKEILLKKLYLRVKNLKQRYKLKTTKYRKVNNIANMTITGCGALATTCLILSFSYTGGPLLLVSVAASSLSTIGAAIFRASNVSNKYEAYKTAYLSYADLTRELRLKLTMKLKDNELEFLISDVNDRLGLIEINAPTIISNSEQRMDESIEPLSEAPLKRLSI
jgi:hypothetical protein